MTWTAEEEKIAADASRAAKIIWRGYNQLTGTYHRVVAKTVVVASLGIDRKYLSTSLLVEETNGTPDALGALSWRAVSQRDENYSQCILVALYSFAMGFPMPEYE